METTKFESGTVVATPRAVEVAGRMGFDINGLLTRHFSGDWGDIPEDDKKANERGVRLNERILSMYETGGVKMFVITEQDRSYTTVMLTNEY